MAKIHPKSIKPGMLIAHGVSESYPSRIVLSTRRVVLKSKRRNGQKAVVIESQWADETDPRQLGRWQNIHTLTTGYRYCLREDTNG